MNLSGVGETLYRQADLLGEEPAVGEHCLPVIAVARLARVALHARHGCDRANRLTRHGCARQARHGCDRAEVQRRVRPGGAPTSAGGEQGVAAGQIDRDVLAVQPKRGRQPQVNAG